MQPDFFQTWVPIALGVVNLGGWAWAVLQSPSRENAKSIAALTASVGTIQTGLDTKILSVERRVSTLEDAIKHLPDKESMHRLELNMEKMAGAVNVIGAEMKAVKDISVMTRDMIGREAA